MYWEWHNVSSARVVELNFLAENLDLSLLMFDLSLLILIFI